MSFWAANPRPRRHAEAVGARGRAAVDEFEPRAVAMRRERIYRQAISRFAARQGMGRPTQEM